MSKAITINLKDTVLFNIMVDLAEAVSRETTKMARYSHDVFNDFLTPRHYPIGLISPVNKNNQNIIKGTAHKVRPSDIEIAQFVELKAKEAGFQSHGIKLLPQSTGEILEFTFDAPKEREKVLCGGGS